MINTILADADRRIETPEGIALTLPIADPISRGYAFAIDLIIRVLMLFLLGATLGLFKSVGLGLFLIILFVIWWGYYVICEMLMNGTSPGKKIMKLQVLNDDFTPIHFSSSLIRNILRTADALPGFYGLAATTMLFNGNNQRLGDIAAKTIVVSTTRQHYKAISINESALLPPVAFTAEEQRNVIAFARFCENHTQERAAEMAQHLSQGLNEPNAVKLANQLCRYAKWFLGESR